MTDHLTWLQGPTDNPDPTINGMAASAYAAETAMDAEWGHLYPKPRTEPEEAA